MDSLLADNQQLEKNIENYMEEIEKQKELNSQHENQIEMLLKFNQRLLEIIQNQLGNNKKDNCSLQPISQRSERESDLLGGINTFNSLIKSKKLVARSEWGGATKESLIDRAHMINKKKPFQEQSEEHSLYIKDDVPNTPTMRGDKTATIEISQNIAEGASIKTEMQNQIKEFKKFNNESNNFYSNKIEDIKKLNKKISNYNPMDELKKITSKINISSQTNDLIKNRIFNNQRN